jgi:hypothetical protein
MTRNPTSNLVVLTLLAGALVSGCGANVRTNETVAGNGHTKGAAPAATGEKAANPAAPAPESADAVLRKSLLRLVDIEMKVQSEADKAGASDKVAVLSPEAQKLFEERQSLLKKLQITEADLKLSKDALEVLLRDTLNDMGPDAAQGIDVLSADEELVVMVLAARKIHEKDTMEKFKTVITDLRDHLITQLQVAHAPSYRLDLRAGLSDLLKSELEISQELASALIPADLEKPADTAKETSK